ncbi:MAG: hypothetical protein LC104_08055 [Bacteroidales bacterium]|nr:hypothetical protein [Bacteroidales bacterium]
MGRKKTDEVAATLSPHRAARLYRLLVLTAEAPRTRKLLLNRLKLDLRGFYRDLEFLRSLGIEVSLTDERYQLPGELNAALSRLPLPDPCLSFQEAMQLSQGHTTAHHKLRRRLESLINGGKSSASSRTTT